MKHRKEQGPAIYTLKQEDGRIGIERNGRWLMTPAGKPYALPTLPLAQEILKEWQAQGEKINPLTMPLCQLASTALDIISKDRAKITGGLLAYIGSELLCHRAEGPDDLIQKQNEVWQPYLDWCRDRYDIAFKTGSGIMPIEQSGSIAPRLEKVIDAMDDFALAGLSSATDSAGSLVLGLALAEGFRPAPDIFEAAELDALHQAIKWGQDPAAAAKQDTIRADLQACERWFGLLKG